MHGKQGGLGVQVELRSVHKYYGGVSALSGVDLTSARGEMIVLLGPSGCGKTTALRALAGLERIDSGQIVMDGRDVTQLPVSRRGIGMVFQSYSLFPNMTALHNVAFGLKVRHWEKQRRISRARELLSLVELEKEEARYPNQLSGGQQQRVALARALAVEPRMLLLDEPLSALDAKVRTQLREEIRHIQAQLGVTTFFVTHDQEEALAIADRIVVMDHGAVSQIGTPYEVYTSPKNDFVAGFIGVVNRLPGELVGPETIHVPDIGSFPFDATASQLTRGNRVHVLVRPEAIAVSPDPQGPAEVIFQTFLGSSMRLVVKLDSGVQVTVALSIAEASPLVGVDRVSLSPRGRALLVKANEQLPRPALFPQSA